MRYIVQLLRHVFAPLSARAVETAMLELAILGLLKEQPLHGYELKKRLGETLGFVWGVSFGSLYPALRRLERSGAIERVEELDGPVAVPVPATGSLSGESAAARLRRRTRPNRRTRKAFRITPVGEELFAQLLVAEPTAGGDEEKAFALKLAFCRYLPPDARLELLERRRADLLDRLARSRRALGGRGGIVGRDRYSRSLAEHRTLSTERDLAWVEELIADERGAPQEGATA